MQLPRQSTVWLAVCLLAQSTLFAGDGGVLQTFKRPYLAPVRQAPVLTNSPRFEQLLRAGNLYLTLEDAVQLAIENNLDVEIQRYARATADTDLLRTRGGGLTRGLSLNLSEMPAGVGGPTSQLLTSSSRIIPGTSVSTNPLEVGALGVVQTNLSITGATALSTGSAIPVFDPFLSGNFNYSHLSTPQTNLAVAGAPNLITGNTSAGLGYRQGFGSGAAVSAAFTNLRQTTNSIRGSYSPYTASALTLNVTQPLLRGAGFSVNRRFQRQAENEQKIADLLFRQQLINTVYGVSRLYYDFVALYEDVKVKEETLRLAQKLFDDTKAQVDEGALATVEMARANAQVFSTRLDLERARGLLEEQEVIVKTVLTRRGSEDDIVRKARIIPMGTLALPPEENRESPELVSIAAQNRPDLSTAALQIANSELSLKGSRNALKPQVDIVAFATNNGLAGDVNPVAVTPDSTFIGSYASALGQIFRRDYPSYGAGLQIDLPMRNRVAQADVARDEIQFKQTKIREQQLRNQARLEVEDALIAQRRAKAAYEAAIQARVYQEESLKAEQAKFEVGASTSYLVIQFQSFLAQARSTEVAARGAYVKARAALQRATGTILADYNISVEAAHQGAR
ncbi:TolC family protein [Paludibaculum fermentans]|uniref:TolC family protein n=1 Tax=Paludibaculum fermentans TaxID=1473598 RepID=A0A7S7SKS1_PALFE|nr:TolC family protein [Paludibaculum fermentans]QOY89467.1 TolC family protein [Paludibaculum fermentans]